MLGGMSQIDCPSISSEPWKKIDFKRASGNSIRTAGEVDQRARHIHQEDIISLNSNNILKFFIPAF